MTQAMDSARAVSLPGTGAGEESTDDLMQEGIVGRLRLLVDPNQAGLLVALAGIAILLSIIAPSFDTLRNTSNMSRAASYIGIASAGEGMVLIGGGLDLSVSAVMALSGAVAARLLMVGLPWPVAGLLAIVVGAVVGLGNGVLVSYVGINAFVVTIGSNFLVTGIAYFVTSGQTLLVSSKQLLYLGQGTILGIPVPALLALAAFLVMGWILSKTLLGRHVFAIGGTPNGTMARLAGIAVDRQRTKMYVISGVFAAIAGVILMGFTGSAQAFAATDAELLVIAAVILGGVALTGGRGSMRGVFLGTVLLAMISNGIILLQLSTGWQYATQGGVLLVAVAVDEIRQKMRSR